MPVLKTVGVKQLKNELSAYLRDVGTGTKILVTDRGRVIAEIRKPNEGNYPTGDSETILMQWREQGILIEPRSLAKSLEKSPVSLPEGSSQSLLNWIRGK